ncbi:MAG: hypothetical protein ACYTGL_09160 [Planctomycetota bacterium]|jgi:hypothetical protein
MKKLFALVFGFGLGLGAMFLAFNVHVVRTETDWHVVKKQKVQFADWYADIRKWDAEEWTRHPDLTKALVDSGKGDLVPRIEAEDLLLEVIDRWQNARRDGETRQQ